MYTSNRSRSFLLLEVLIALLLVTICIVPLMRLPLLHFRRQIDNLSDFEMHRISDWTFSEIKEQFLRESIPWEKLPKRGETSAQIPLSKTTLEIPSLRSKKISRSFTLNCTGEKEGLKGEIHRLYEITVYLDQTKLDPPYRILVTRDPGRPHQTSQ